MEPNKFEIITTTDKAKRDALFQDLRLNGLPNERMVVKFSGNQLMDGTVGRYESTFSVAYPKLEWKPNHGSARNPRKFPGRKKAA